MNSPPPFSGFIAAAALFGCDSTLQVLEGARQPDASEDPGLALRASGVSSGTDHTCALSSGRVYCWGNDEKGAVSGRPASEMHPVTTPSLVDGVDRAVSIASAEGFSCALDRGGTVLCWGDNAEGALGTGDRDPRSAPVVIPLPSPAARLSARFRTACAVLSDRTLWCWGDNLEGQAGQGDTHPGEDALRPVRVGDGSGWTDVGTGQGHTCAVEAPGALFCWGRNTGGELGVGQAEGGQLRSPRRVGADDDWTFVSAGQNQTCALRDDGSLWCWGENGMAQLGTGSDDSPDVPTRSGTENDVREISLHTFGGCSVRSSDIFCWGRNVEGQLGTGDLEDRSLPARVGLDRDWVQVSVGRFHACAVKANGTVWCTGENVDGRLGTGDLDRRNTMSIVIAPIGALP